MGGLLEIKDRAISPSQVAFNINRKIKNALFAQADSDINSSLLAGEDISANSLVYIDSSGLIKTANYASFATIGIVTQELLEDDPATIIFEGKVTMPAHGFTIGESLFLTTGTPNFSNTLPILTSGDLIQRVGYAMDADTIYLNIEEAVKLE